MAASPSSSKSKVFSLEERKIQAHKLCGEYLGGSWSEVSLNEFGFKVLTGGLSNEIFICNLPEHFAENKQEVRQVLFRIYGRLVGKLISNIHSLVAENVVFALLAEKKIAPKLYAIFPEGRLEEFLQAKSLTVAEIRSAENSVKIARKLREFHGLSLPLGKNPKWFWERCERYNAYTYTTPNKYINEILLLVASCYISILLSKNPSDRCFQQFKSRTTVPCNHSLFSVRDKPEPYLHVDNEGQQQYDLLFIDYEYCGYNYRGFDLANHFNEWMWDYKHEEAPYYLYNPELFPSLEQQLLFIRTYLGEQTNCHSPDKISPKEQELLDEVQRFALVSNFFWGMWSVVQAKMSNIEFGY
ncbi:predicted protein, partial [Nematostella vectensis]